MTYQAQDNAVRLGKQVRRAIVHPEGHMDDAFAVTRAQQGESKTSMVILRTVTLLKARVSLTVHFQMLGQCPQNPG